MLLSKLKEKKGFVFEELIAGKLFISYKNDDNWMEFTVYEWEPAMAEGDDELVPLMSGAGSTGLRELRHTQWGDDGYINYPRKLNFEAVFKFLSKYFDLN